MKGSAIWSTFRILLFGVSLPIQALAVTVTSLNDSGPGSLRQAIADAPADGTIDFAVTGTIVLTSGQLIITNDLTVNGPGATELTISQNQSGRICLVSNAIVNLSGLTIADGRAFGGNYYNWGGGIINFGTLSLENCTVSSNSAVFGGGVANWDLGNLTLSNCVVSSNSAFEGGGGINNYGTLVIVVGSTISGNVLGPPGLPGASLYGSGVHGGSLIISNSTVSSNQGGCGITCFCGTVLIANCTITGNGTYGLLHECSWPDSTVTIRNSIFSGNGGGSRSDCAGSFVSQDYNLIQNNYTDPFFNVSDASFTGATNHNIYGQDPKLGPLADNGGPTTTHALRFDSPAIDAGHSGGAAMDQRGLPRPIDDPNRPDAAGGDGCDMGAYEADPILKVSGIEVTGAGVSVGFNTVLGRSYRLEAKTNLDNSWRTNSDNIPGTGSANQTVNAGTATVPQQFYRVRLLP